MAVHYEDDGVRIHKIVASPYNNNAYIIVCKSTGKSLIIDTPRDADLVLAEAAGTDVTAVAITHGHRDHIEGYDAFRAGLTAPFGLHRDDTPRLAPNAPEFHLEDGESLQVGELSLELLHTPGHTPGGVCLLMGSTFSPATPSSPAARARPRPRRPCARSSRASPAGSSPCPTTPTSTPATAPTPPSARRRKSTPISPAAPTRRTSAATSSGAALL